MVMVTIYTRIPAVTNLNKTISISSVVSITVELKQTLFNVIGYSLRYQYANQTTPNIEVIFLFAYFIMTTTQLFRKITNGLQFYHFQ
jgi:hypothetical protein